MNLSLLKFALSRAKENPHSHKLVKTYQLHTHSKSCRKHKNVTCRYSFGNFFTGRTIIAEPLHEEMDGKSKAAKIRTSGKVKSYIGEDLNPAIIPMKDGYIDTSTILRKLETTEEQCYSALSVSSGTDSQLHVWRLPNSCFTSNYFEEANANLDIQPVFI